MADNHVTGKIPVVIRFSNIDKKEYTIPEICDVIRDNFGKIDINNTSLSQQIRRYAKQLPVIEGTSERKTKYSKDSVETLLMVYMYNYLLKHNGKIHERQEQIKIVKQRLEELPEMMYEALTEPLSDEERFNSEVNRKMDEYRAKIAIDFICKNLISIDEDLLRHDVELLVDDGDETVDTLEACDRLSELGNYYIKK